jgi:hypothetical protein
MMVADVGNGLVSVESQLCCHCSVGPALCVVVVLRRMRQLEALIRAKINQIL